MKLHWQQDFNHRAFPKFALNPNGDRFDERLSTKIIYHRL